MTANYGTHLRRCAEGSTVRNEARYKPRSAAWETRGSVAKGAPHACQARTPKETAHGRGETGLPMVRGSARGGPGHAAHVRRGGPGRAAPGRHPAPGLHAGRRRRRRAPRRAAVVGGATRTLRLTARRLALGAVPAITY